MSELRSFERKAHAMAKRFHPVDALPLCLNCYGDFMSLARARRKPDMFKTFQSKCPDLLDAIMRCLMAPRDHTEAGRIALSNRLMQRRARCPKCSRGSRNLPQTTQAFDIVYNEFVLMASAACIRSDSRQHAAFGGRRAVWPLSSDQLFPFGATQGIDSLVSSTEYEPYSIALIGILLRRHKPLVYPEIMEPYNRVRLLRAAVFQLRRFVELARPILQEYALAAQGSLIPVQRARDTALAAISHYHEMVDAFLTALTHGPEATPNAANIFARHWTGGLYRAIVDAVACLQDASIPHPNGLVTTAGILYTDLDAADRRDPPEYVRSHIQRCTEVYTDPYLNLWALGSHMTRNRSCYGCRRFVHESTTGKPFPRCGRCRLVQYCSPECQRRDWTAARYPDKAICDILRELSQFVSWDRNVMNIEQFAAACHAHAFPPDRAIMLAKWIYGGMRIYDDTDMPVAYKELLTDTIGAAEDQAGGPPRLLHPMNPQARAECERIGLTVHPATGLAFDPNITDPERHMKALDLLTALRGL
ncbi:hypothetical protein EXIGLDRAFT_834754 [Exidia glandulosa HHB12029]|uniref:MYND-type domain-containing protein n=1 Tax=Exidia glandulosa HHB12029 TaxID=1314781 RepID=A0A165JFW4_EXIGL|nr:hypothetical protein EXIGLDRAFT_834754 [Exidia glandulosa HHB12029]